MPLWSMGAKDLQAEHVASFDEVITLEDHLHDGGFGSWVIESLAAKCNLRDRITVNALDSRVCGVVGSQQALSIFTQN